MVLGVDIGNAEIKAGGFSPRGLEYHFCLDANTRRTADQYAAEFLAQFSLCKAQAGAIEGAILSSVVPAITPAVAGALRRLTGKRALVVGPGIKTGLDLKIENPVSTGTDIVCGAVGALSRFPPPLAVFDFGTATTVAALDEKGALVGKAILAGVQLSLDALAARTACLPALRVQRPKGLLAKNTAEAILSGAVYGAAAMVDALAARYRGLLGEGLTCVLTGGLSAAIAPYCETPVRQEAHLTLYGLWEIYLRNRPSAL